MKCIEGKINKGMGIENGGNKNKIGENILFMIM